MTSVLLVMKGFAGSGKSTLARALSRDLDWPLVDKDDVKDLLDGHITDSGRFAYDIMFNVARRQLQQGLSVICDSPLTYPGLYEQARQTASRTGAALAVIECVCSDETEWQRRIDGRKALGLATHHQTDWEAFAAMRAQTLALTRYPITDPLLTVDTARMLDDVVAEVMEWLLRLRSE